MCGPAVDSASLKHPNCSILIGSACLRGVMWKKASRQEAWVTHSQINSFPFLMLNKMTCNLACNKMISIYSCLTLLPQYFRQQCTVCSDISGTGRSSEYTFYNVHRIRSSHSLACDNEGLKLFACFLNLVFRSPRLHFCFDFYHPITPGCVN